MLTENETMLGLVMLPAVCAIVGGIWLSARKAALRAQAPSPESEAHMRELLDTARRMEQRIGYLERVLDNEAPGWRSRSEAR
jgi:phage shock protein B